MHGTSSTETISVSSAADLSREIGAYYQPLRTTHVGSGRFGAQLNTKRSKDVVIGAVRAGSHCVERTSGLIGNAQQTYINFGFLMDGRGIVSQSGKTAQLKSGDFFINDPDVPFSLNFDTPSHLLYFLFPRKMIGLSARNVDALVARPVGLEDPVSQFVRPFLSQFDRYFGLLDEISSERLLHSALDLIGVVAQEMLTNDAQGNPRDTHRLTLLQRAQEYINENLHDSSLTPTTVAEALFITPRHLHGIFQPEGITVATWIRERRLEQCRRDLSDPRQLHLPLAAIGERWGFDEASHFSRVFRTAFGVSPRKYRDEVMLNHNTQAALAKPSY